MLSAHKFRLHPSTPEEAVAAHRAPPTAPPTYARPAAPPSPPAPTPARPYAPAPPARPAAPGQTPARAPPARTVAGAHAVQGETLGDMVRRHKVAIALVGAVALLALIAGGAIYYTTSPTAQYPERYLLKEKEAPDGLFLGPLPIEAQGQLGSSENPGPLNEKALDQFGDFTGARPEEGWVQVFSDSEQNDVLVNFALRFEDAETAEKWASTARFQCRDGKTHLYQVGAVVVFLFADDELGIPKLKEAAASLEEKASNLERIC